MPKRPEAYPALYRAGGEASSFAYGHITMNASGSALAQIAMGRRSIAMTGSITNHAHRMGKALEHLLRNKKAREELRQLIDSYDAPAV